MKLNVRLFALYRERAGSSSIPVAVEDGATVADLTAELSQSEPSMGKIVAIAAFFIVGVLGIIAANKARNLWRNRT